MLLKSTRPITDCSFGSPAEILFGDRPLFPEVAPQPGLQTEQTSRDWLARAEGALRRTQLSECQRCVGQALRCLGHESRALTVREWLFLAGVALMNSDPEAANHRIVMARQAFGDEKGCDSSSDLQLRILILQSLITGASSPEAGNAELLVVFRFLTRHCCPSLCRQALIAKRLLQEWRSPGSSVAWWNSLNMTIEPGKDHLEFFGTSRPEWN